MHTILDIFLTVFHVSIVLFNLFGWIPRATRKANVITILLTAASWFILGIWYGIGYCPVTEWQWQVKEKLGEQNLPSNFIEYIAEKWTGHDFDPGFVSIVIAVCFVLAVLASIYVNFLLPYLKTKPTRKV
jgi:hypothetical protein